MNLCGEGGQHYLVISPKKNQHRIFFISVSSPNGYYWKKSKLYTIRIRMLSRLIISIAFLFSLWFSQKEKGKMNNDQKREMYVQVQW